MIKPGPFLGRDAEIIMRNKRAALFEGRDVLFTAQSKDEFMAKGMAKTIPAGSQWDWLTRTIFGPKQARAA